MPESVSINIFVIIIAHIYLFAGYTIFLVLIHGNSALVKTRWGRVTHICVSKLTITGSDNGRRQAITLTNAGILLTGPLGANFSEIFIEIYIFSLKKRI